MENSIEELKTNYEQNPIFEFFSQDEFDRFLDITQPITYKKEEVIFETGQEPRGLYVITEGRVQITQNKAGKPARILAEIKAPTVLGEMALLEKRHRTSTATSLTKTTVLFLDKCKFMELLEQDELMAFKLSHNLGKILTQKIEAMNNAMMDMKQQFKEFSNFKKLLVLRLELLKNDHFLGTVSATFGNPVPLFLPWTLEASDRPVVRALNASPQEAKDSKTDPLSALMRNPWDDPVGQSSTKSSQERTSVTGSAAASGNSTGVTPGSATMSLSLTAGALSTDSLQALIIQSLPEGAPFNRFGLLNQYDASVQLKTYTPEEGFNRFLELYQDLKMENRLGFLEMGLNSNNAAIFYHCIQTLYDRRHFPSIPILDSLLKQKNLEDDNRKLIYVTSRKLTYYSVAEENPNPYLQDLFLRDDPNKYPDLIRWAIKEFGETGNLKYKDALTPLRKYEFLQAILDVTEIKIYLNTRYPDPTERYIRAAQHKIKEVRRWGADHLIKIDELRAAMFFTLILEQVNLINGQIEFEYLKQAKETHKLEYPNRYLEIELMHQPAKKIQLQRFREENFKKSDKSKGIPGGPSWSQ